MAEWLYEAGVGEARTALVEDGAILEAAIERDDGALRAGAVLDARFARATLPGGRGIAVADGVELWLEPLPAGLSEGRPLRVEVVREALFEAGRAKPPRVRPAADGAAPGHGPDLRARIAATGLPVVDCAAHGPDRLEAAGWSELLEEAATGEIGFPGGALRLSLTPAMALFDVDGVLPPADLAVAGAAAAGRAIRRMGIAGSIGIDLPTVPDRAARQAAAAALDAVVPQPFERTAVNGFGFLQLVRRRARPSLAELLQADPALAAALALVRQAERARGAGHRKLVANGAITTILESRPDWIAALSRRTGAPIALRVDPALPISAAYVDVANPSL